MQWEPCDWFYHECAQGATRRFSGRVIDFQTATAEDVLRPGSAADAMWKALSRLDADVSGVALGIRFDDPCARVAANGDFLAEHFHADSAALNRLVTNGAFHGHLKSFQTQKVFSQNTATLRCHHLHYVIKKSFSYRGFAYLWIFFIHMSKRSTSPYPSFGTVTVNRPFSNFPSSFPRYELVTLLGAAGSLTETVTSLPTDSL